MAGARFKANANHDKAAGFSLRKILATAKIKQMLLNNMINKSLFVPCRLSEPCGVDKTKY